MLALRDGRAAFSGGRRQVGAALIAAACLAAARGEDRRGALVLRKDLLSSSPLETVPAMALFAIVTFVIFHFGLVQIALGAARRGRADGDPAVRGAAGDR